MKKFQVHQLDADSGAFRIFRASEKAARSIQEAAASDQPITLTVYSQYPRAGGLPLTPETFSVVGRITSLIGDRDGSGFAGEIEAR